MGENGGRPDFGGGGRVAETGQFGLMGIADFSLEERPCGHHYPWTFRR